MGNCVDNISFDQDEPKKLTEGRWNFTVSTKRDLKAARKSMRTMVHFTQNPQEYIFLSWWYFLARGMVMLLLVSVNCFCAYLWAKEEKWWKRWTHFSFWSFDIVTVALCYEFVLLTARLYREKRGDVTSDQELWFKTSNWVNRLHLALVSISDTLALTSAMIYAPFFHSSFSSQNEIENEDEIRNFNFPAISAVQALSVLVDLFLSAKPRWFGHMLGPMVVTMMYSALIIIFSSVDYVKRDLPLFSFLDDHGTLGGESLSMMIISLVLLASVTLLHCFLVFGITLRDLLFAHIEDLRNEKESDRELEEQREDQIAKEMSGVINNMEASTSVELGKGDHRSGKKKTFTANNIRASMMRSNTKKV